MTYVVIKVGQLHEHDLLTEAEHEAARLVKLEDNDFYIAELVKRSSRSEVSWITLTFNDSDNLWDDTLDETLQDMWASHKYSLMMLANHFNRTIDEIVNRLNKLGFGTYTKGNKL